MRYSTYEVSDMCWFRHKGVAMRVGYTVAADLRRGDRSVGAHESFDAYRLEVYWAATKRERIKRKELLEKIPNIDSLVLSRLDRDRLDEKLFDEVERQNYP